MSAVTHPSSRPKPPVVVEATRRHLHLVPQLRQADATRSRRSVYARRRFAAVLTMVIVLAGAVLAGRAMAATGGGASDQVVTVHPGETLSDIAARESPSAPNSQAVVVIQMANHLGSSDVTAGRRLVIPHG